MGIHLSATLRELAKLSNMLFQHDVGQKCLVLGNTIEACYSHIIFIIILESYNFYSHIGKSEIMSYLIIMGYMWS